MEEPPPPAHSSAGERGATHLVAPARFMSVKGAAAAMGLTEASVRARIARGIWLDGKHFRRAPDHRIYIDLRAIEKWIESGS